MQIDKKCDVITEKIANDDKIIIPTKAKIYKEANGSFYLDLECGLEYINYIIQNNIIVAPTPQGEQAFRITNREITKNCNDALDHLNMATDNASPFTTLSNVQTISSFRCVRKSL